MHHPIYSMACDAMSIVLREQLHNVFVANKVDLVIQAHVHNYSRSNALGADGAVVDYGATDNLYTKDAGVVYMSTFPAGNQSNPIEKNNINSGKDTD